MQSAQKLTQQNQDAFSQFFDKYISSSNKLQIYSVRELAQKLAIQYFSAQLPPRYQTENNLRKKSRNIVYKQIETDAIEKAKAQYKAKKERKESQQRKLPPVPKKQNSQPRSLSVQPPIKCLSAQPKRSVPSTYFYYIGDGNNNELIKKLLDERQNWVQVKDVTLKNINFKWQETEKGYEYRTLAGNLKDSTPQMLNHFEFHIEISNKYYLAQNFKTYCEKNLLNAQDYIPISFAIECTNSNLKAGLFQFLTFYRSYCPQNQQQELDKTIKSYQFKYGTQVESKIDQYPTLFAGENLWIFKPSNMNQGRGIHVVRNLQEIIDIYNRYQNGYKEHLLEVKRNEQNEIVTKIIYINTLMTEQFVIQKYIEKPLLIKGRKFDIRTYVLITSNLGFFFFKEGQLRLATEIFDVKKQSNYVHLTNNAVQYTHPQYGKTEEGNQFNFDQASQYFKIDFRKEVIQKLKQISLLVFTSVKGKINKYKRKNCFEVFGMDFILDVDFKPWLIEVNTNPSLEVTSKLLGSLFPRLIDDAFKLTIDRQFHQQKSLSKYPFLNYSNDENLWEYICQL
ncbi:unnamed protein product [Paramecium sonneborni]|uniref:Tubulin-tyrosine ligase family protein n=1 Tax=Paramecium sonneborni TaxID=65129 RepID=A0A8S1PIP2_9CILI|nr:unnamed protein product [Paramecium sonneborni]